MVGSTAPRLHDLRPLCTSHTHKPEPPEPLLPPEPPPGPEPDVPGVPGVPEEPGVPGQAGGILKSVLGQVGQGSGWGLEVSRGMVCFQPKTSLPAVTAYSMSPKAHALLAQ